MRRSVLVAAVLLVSGCQSSVKVPTAQELLANKQLLAEWQRKCGTGEYSQLGAAEKAEMCSTTQNAVISVAQTRSGQADADFFEANSKRK
jgi:hypothetical protein